MNYQGFDNIVDFLQMKLQELPLQPHGIIYREAAEYLADALSAAGIGDVSEWNHRAESYKKALKGLARQYCLLRGYKTKQVNFDVDGETIQIFLNEEDEKQQEDKK